MSLDLRTLYVALGAVCILLSGMLLPGNRNDLGRDGRKQWIAGHACQGLFWIFLGLRGAIPDSISIASADVLLSLNYSFLHAAIRRFQCRDNTTVSFFLPVVAAVFVVASFWFYTDNLVARALCIRGLSCFQMGSTAFTLFKAGELKRTPLQWSMGVLFLIGALLWFTQFLGVLMFSGEQNDFLSRSNFQGILLLIGFAVVILTCIGFIAMLRERGAKELSESERRFRDLYENAPSANFSASPTGEILRFNGRAENLLGFSAEKLSGTPILDLYADTPHGKKRAVEVFRRFQVGESISGEELQMRRADNSPLWVSLEMNAVLDEQGRIVESRSMIIDIEKRKKFEAALLASEERLKASELLYKTLTEKSLSGVYVVQNSKFKYVNPKVACDIGYTVAELLGKTIDNYIHPDDLEYMRLQGRKAVENGQTEPYRLRIVKSNGSLGWFLAINARIAYEGRAAVLGNSIDITGHVRSEEALQKTLNELRETKDQLVQAGRLAAAGQLAEGAAHEIRNPLHVILMRIQIMELKKELDEDFRAAFNLIKIQANRIINILDALYKFAHVPGKKPAVVELNQVVKKVIAQNAQLFESHGIEVEVQMENVPRTLLDPQLILKALQCVITNAQEAMADQKTGRLQIKTGIVSRSNENRIQISISDSGHGIREEDMPRLYDPFFTSKDPDKGIGMGLPIAYRIIQDHGGRIWAVNKKLRGATFFIELPLIVPEKTDFIGAG